MSSTKSTSFDYYDLIILIFLKKDRNAFFIKWQKIVKNNIFYKKTVKLSKNTFQALRFILY